MVMPKIIIEPNGRPPLPDNVRKKQVCFRISPKVLKKLEDYVSKHNITKASALEKAINELTK